MVVFFLLYFGQYWKYGKVTTTYDHNEGLTSCTDDRPVDRLSNLIHYTIVFGAVSFRYSFFRVTILPIVTCYLYWL